MLNRDSIISCIWKILSANLVQQVHEYTVGGAVMLSVFTGQKNELLLYSTLYSSIQYSIQNTKSKEDCRKHSY